MALLAAFTLLCPGTFLDRAWSLNPSAYRRLSAGSRLIGIPFLLLSVALAAAGIGWTRRRRWGWSLAAMIIAIQLAGDALNAFRGRWWEGALGVTIAGALLAYLLRPRVRRVFG